MPSLKRFWPLGVGLSITPLAVASAARVSPRLPLDEAAANVVAFAGATLFPLLGLACAALVEVRLAIAFSFAAVSATTLLIVALLRPAPLPAVLAVDSALVCLSWALGCSVGRRVQHASHLLPACVVAASADLVSLVSPEGPSHVIARSEPALSVLAVWFPVPGRLAVAPALGVGDLLFIGLALGVARKHGLPYRRSLLACALGVALAGVAAAWSELAIPALVPIAGLLVVALPEIRQLRTKERRVAHWSMLIASSVAFVTILRALWSGR